MCVCVCVEGRTFLFMYFCSISWYARTGADLPLACASQALSIHISDCSDGLHSYSISRFHIFHVFYYWLGISSRFKDMLISIRCVHDCRNVTRMFSRRINILFHRLRLCVWTSFLFVVFISVYPMPVPIYLLCTRSDAKCRSKKRKEKCCRSYGWLCKVWAQRFFFFSSFAAFLCLSYSPSAHICIHIHTYTTKLEYGTLATQQHIARQTAFCSHCFYRHK